MKGRGDGLLFLVVVGRGQKTNGTDSFVLTTIFALSGSPEWLAQRNQFGLFLNLARTQPHFANRLFPITITETSTTHRQPDFSFAS